MHKQLYYLSPVEVVKVTSQNLEEVAEWCGGSVQQTESRRVEGRMDSYVWVPTPKGTNISWAFPGMFITKRLVVTVKGDLRATWAVFRRDYFEKNYFQTPGESVKMTWEQDETQSPKKNDIDANVYVSDAMEVAIEKIKANVQEIADAAGVDLEEEAIVEVAEETVEKQLTGKELVNATLARNFERAISR